VSEIMGRIGGGRQEPEVTDDPEELRADARGARWLRRNLAGGVLAVTTVIDGEFRASTVTGGALVSTDPPQLLVSIDLDSQMEGWIGESGVFALSVLAWEHQVLADRLAGLAPLVPRTFTGIDHFTAFTGAPLLSDCIAWADCRVVDDLITGDHRCFIGQVLRLGAGTADPENPLVYHLRRYRRLR